MNAPAGLPPLAKLLVSLSRVKTVQYLDVSSAALFIYDHLTTFSDEVELIWHAPWNTGKVLFLAVRYMVWPELIVLLSSELLSMPASRCYGGLIYIAWSLVAGITLTEMVLVLRTWALWGGHRAIMLGLACLLLVITSINAWIIVGYTKNTHIEKLPVAGCTITSSPRQIVSVWIQVATFELVIVTLTVARGLAHFRTSSSSLLTSLYRDGILNYIYLLAVSVANMVIVVSGPDEYTILLAELQRSLHAILSCRIILNLRSMSSARRITPMGTETVSDWFGAKEQASAEAI